MAKAAAAFAALAVADGIRLSRKSSCGVKGLSAQIVNGEDASECEWKWQVGLKSTGSSMPFCGGMLIDPEWVLTAAHCASKPDFDVEAGDFKPRVTSGKEQRIAAAEVIRHPGYNSRTMVWDFALIRLASPVQLTECVGTVCLPTQGADVMPGQTCWITGWGTLQSGGSQPDILQEAQVKIISNGECTTTHNYSSSEITPDMICAQGTRNGSPTDACQGDSGGPLVCENNGVFSIYGATSWGYGCADKDFPGIWARVHEALGWIEETMGGGGSNPEPSPSPPVSSPSPAPKPGRPRPSPKPRAGGKK